MDAVRITRDEVFNLRDAKRTTPAGHPTGFVVTDEFFHVVDAHHPMLNDFPDEDYGNVLVEMVDPVCHGAGHSLSVASAPSSVPSPAAPVQVPSPSGASTASTKNDALHVAVISQFLQEAGLSDLVSSDVTQMQGALQARMDQNDGNQTGSVDLPPEDVEIC